MSWADGRSKEAIKRMSQINNARRRAQHKVAERHPEEFALIFAQEKRGIEPAPKSKKFCGCGLPVDQGTMCEFCAELENPK